MKIVVCGGNSKEQETLCHLVEDKTRQWQLECEIQCFDRGESFLHGIEAGATCDYLMVQLPLDGMNGIITVLHARVLLPEMQIAFLDRQGTPDCAVEAFGLNALHYVAQPVTEAVVEELLLRYVRKAQLTIAAIPVKIGGVVCTLSVRHIEMVVSAGRKCNVYLWDREEPLSLSVTFSKMKELLQAENFLEISRGFLVHMDYIQTMGSENCVLRNGTTLLLSRSNRRKLRTAYQEYRAEKLRQEQERIRELLQETRIGKLLIEYIQKLILQLKSRD